MLQNTYKYWQTQELLRKSPSCHSWDTCVVRSLLCHRTGRKRRRLRVFHMPEFGGVDACFEDRPRIGGAATERNSCYSKIGRGLGKVLQLCICGGYVIRCLHMELLPTLSHLVPVYHFHALFFTKSSKDHNSVSRSRASI